MLGVIGYLLRKRDAEDKEWRKRTDAKIDEIHASVMAALSDYVQRGPHLEVHRSIKDRLDGHTQRISALEQAVFYGGEKK